MEKYHCTAVICELNPVHNGHMRVLEAARECSDVVIAVMSGNFTQRAECAVFNKYRRAGMAVRCGFDIVLELPFPWSSADVDGFATGAVSICRMAGADNIAFGSETGDEDMLREIARIHRSPEMKEKITSAGRRGQGYASALDDIYSSMGFTVGKNDKLGAAYIMAASGMGYVPGLTIVKRTGGSTVTSASAIRGYLKEQKDVSLFVPRAVSDMYTSPEISPERLDEIEYLYFRHFAGSVSEDESDVLRMVRKAALESAGSREFPDRCRTKKYTDTRIRREMLFSLLDTDYGMPRQTAPGYTVLLAANSKGCGYLSQLRKDGDLTVLSKPSDSFKLTENGREQYDILCRADELYLSCMDRQEKSGYFLRQSPYIQD